MTALRQASVLFVDDDSLLLDSMRHGFSTFGNKWHARFADCATMALELIDEAPVDVLVTDMVMPDLTGLELVQKLHQGSDHSCKTIILTGRGSFETTLKAINSGHVQRFLTKPCPLATLAKTISELLPEHFEPTTDTQIANAILSKLSPAVMVVSHEGIVTSCNSAAKALLNNYHGLHIDPENRLKAQTPEDSKRLLAAIRNAALNLDEATWHLPLRETENGEKRNLAISGLGHTDHGIGLSMVVITDPDRARVPSAKSLSDYLGLTPAEARLTHALATTSDLEDAASLSGLTEQSARTYLKRIFSKANVHSQGELMRIIFSLPVRHLKSA